MPTRSVTGIVAVAAALVALHMTAAQAAVIEMVLKPCEPGVPQQDNGAKLNVVEGSATFTSQQGTIDLSSKELLTVDCNGNETKSSQNGTILTFASTGTTNSTAGGGGGGTIGSLGQNGANNGGGGNSNGNGNGTNTNTTSNLTGGGVVGGGGLSNPTSP